MSPMDTSLAFRHACPEGISDVSGRFVVLVHDQRTCFGTSEVIDSGCARNNVSDWPRYDACCSLSYYVYPVPRWMARAGE